MLPAPIRAALRLKAVPVFMRLGDSNSVPSGTDVTDTPNGYWPFDPSAFFYDGRGAIGNPGTIQPLIPPSYSTVTISNASPAVVAWAGHGLNANAPILLKTTGALPTGLSTTVSTPYFLVPIDANSFSLSATKNGTAINTSSAGSGTHTAIANIGLEQQPSATYSVVPGGSAAFPTCGPSYETVRQWRVEHPTGPLFFFNGGYGGGGFTDLASFGRPVNWTATLTNGAYVDVVSHWWKFVAQLAGMGYTPDIRLCAISLGGNDVFNGASASHQTNKTNLIAALRRDVIGGAKVLIERINNTSQSALTGSNLAATNTVRAGDLAIVQGDPANIEMLNCDGFSCIADNTHWAMTTHVQIGERQRYHGERQSMWYPMKEIGVLGGNQPTHYWRFGSFTNLYASGALQTVADIGGTAAYIPTQATTTKRPTLGTTTMPNGLPVRSVTGDGVDDALVYTGGANLGATHAILALMSAPSTASKAAMSEGGSTATPSVIHLVSAADGSGKIAFSSRTDGNITTTLTSNLVAFDGTKKAIAKWENAGAPNAINWWVNGVTDTQQTYTRGTITLAHTSFYASEAAGSVALNIAANMDEVITLGAQPDATYLANFYAYGRRRGVA